MYTLYSYVSWAFLSEDLFNLIEEVYEKQIFQTFQTKRQTPRKKVNIFLEIVEFKKKNLAYFF